MSRRGPVIAVSGPPGAGKSTLIAALAARLAGARVVEWDAYETLTARPPEEIEAWIARGADPAEAAAPGLEAALEEAARRGAVLFESPFGREHPPTARLIDMAVWIDAPADLALARKMLQFVAQEGGGAPPPAAWLAGWLRAYERVTRPAARIQRARLRPQADLVISAEAEAADMAERALGLIRARAGIG